MKVWLLFESPALYEPMMVVGVFASEAAALQEADRRESKTRWDYDVQAYEVKS